MTVILYRAAKIAIALLILSGWLVAAYLFSQHRSEPNTFAEFSFLFSATPQVEYKDFVAILLTALAVMIGIAAFLVAVIAIWGFAEGKRMLEMVAQKTAETVAERVAISRVNALIPAQVALAIQAEKDDIGDSDKIAEAYRGEPSGNKDD